MKCIGAGTCGHVHYPAVEAAEFGGNIIGFDRGLLDVIENWKEDDLTGLRLECGDSIVEVFIGPGASSVDPRQECTRRQFDPRRECRELNKVTGVERHCD